MTPSEPRVMILGADPGLRRQLNRKLVDAGIPVDCVEDVRAAIGSLRAETYSVMLIDLSLPPGGERVLDCVQALRPAKRPVVLVLSDSASARSLDVEVVQIVLRKPHNPGYLAELIQSCVETSAKHLGRRSADSDQAIA